MTEAMFYQAVCLPPALDVCPADPTKEEYVQNIADARMQNSLGAIKEVQDNLSKVASCACPCKSYKVIAMRTDSPGVDPEENFEAAELKWFNFNIGGSLSFPDDNYLQASDIYNNNNPSSDIRIVLEPLDEFVYADKSPKHLPITSDANGNISIRGGTFGVRGHLPFKLSIREWDFKDPRGQNNLFRYEGVLSDLYESSTCGTYEKDIILEQVGGIEDFGGTITVKIEVTGEDSCPTVSS